LPAARQLGLALALALWGAIVGVFALFAQFGGNNYWHEGRPFFASLTAFALLAGGMLVFASRGAVERAASFSGGVGAWLYAVLLLFIFLIYALGTGTASLGRVGAAAALIFLPLLLLATAGAAAAGRWQDYLTVAAVWTAVKFGPNHWLWPYPGGRLAYILTVMLAVNVAIAGFLLLRGCKNVGYNIGWGSDWTLSVLGALLVFGIIAIPLGLRLHFLSYAPRWHEWKSFLPFSIAILCFTAWPEEFLFRGLLQNMLSQAGKSETAGWIAASVLFGFSHISNMHFPNWPYVLLASLAGLVYGWTWRRTGSIFASALVHAGVDILWHFLFRSP
jgi:membrane protease YdiL (CAAX protease family)